MSHEYDKDEAGSGFVMGLLTGTVLGAGLGMLFAPKTGSELRGQLSDGANTVGRTASENYRKAAGAANTIAEKGREFYGRAREAVSRGAEEVKRTVDQIQGQAKNEPQPSSPQAPREPVVPGSSRDGGL